MAKRDIFGELMEGVAAIKNHREGKITLRSYQVDVRPLPKGGFQGSSRYPKKAALFAGGIRSQTAD